MDAKEILIKAKAKIADRNNWTKGNMAIDNCGRTLRAGDPTAVAWCAFGAMYSVATQHEHVMRARYALNEAAATLLGKERASATIFNDNGTHTEVMQMFDLAISRLDDPSYQPQQC